ncbi:Uu.00g009230.m01.CDS01 [Anthostomella pinea]|uniref:Uu.00g009230.m01.CDS01 n=1 Tax=Anthostomella pinea TaxID=933095 RepID=A0AAI8VXB4_9PEZI|nr:Uu.00g009230.m01.CDS01 [Anthostomella pinea]
MAKVEFDLMRTSHDGYMLEVIPGKGVQRFVRQTLPHGVQQLDTVDGKIARITYDMKIVGARDLLYNVLNVSPSLAPPQTTYIFSVVSFGYLITGHPLSTGEFFETSTLLVTLIMVGRWVSAVARHKAVESISVKSVQASTAVWSLPTVLRPRSMPGYPYGYVHDGGKIAHMTSHVVFDKTGTLTEGDLMSHSKRIPTEAEHTLR